jgi:hypothetical protein
LNYKHDDVVGQAKFTWFKYRSEITEMMRFLAWQAISENDNYAEMEPEDYMMSSYWFFLPFDTFSPEFKKLNTDKSLAMDVHGEFVKDCWLKALAGCLKYKALKDEIHEYFYSCD